MNATEDILQKEIELVSILYEKEKLKLSEIAKNLKVSLNLARKLVDNLSKKYFLNIFFDRKKKVYYLLQNEIEKNYLNVQFWYHLLMIVFHFLSKSENTKLKNMSILLLFNFLRFFKEKLIDKDSSVFKFFDEDFLFLLNDTFLNYVKEMDYFLFMKIKTAIANKNEIRVTIDDRLSASLKRINLLPLHLAFLRNKWYLVGFDQEIYNYLVIDIEDIKEVFFTGRVWEDEIELSVEDAIPELREYLVPSKKYQVHLDISEYVKVYGLGFLHPSQKIYKKDEKVVLYLEIANLPILFRWLSSYGKVIKILEPEIVKQKYIEYLLSIVESYNE
ncbi:MAG: helix-turn-helix transcriptional regulator [bacterium]